MAGSSPDNTEYRPTVLARLLHSLPHVNVSLHRVNSTFAPQSDIYLESLGILSSIPATWLILTLAALLLYLATRCCDQHTTRRKPRSLAAPRLALAATALLCAAATGLGLYANDDLHNGLVQTLSSARMLNNIIANVRNQTKTISTSLTDIVSSQLTELSDIFDNPVQNQTALALLLTALSSVRDNNTLAMRATADIQRPLAHLDMHSVIDLMNLVFCPSLVEKLIFLLWAQRTTSNVKDGKTFLDYIELGDRWELYRWGGAMGILSGLLALCAVVLVGAARSSRRCLVLASVIALVSAAVAWLLASVGLAAAVALADLCVGPEQYAASVVSQRGLPPELLHYYTHCESVRANPFTQRLRESQQAVTRMRVGLGTVSKLALDLFQNRDLQPKLSALTTEVNACDRGLASLAALLDCRAVHAQWISGTRGLCVAALPGLALLLLATSIAGLLLSILVCLASHTWIYLRKRRDYSQVDETDPFLPAPAASQAVAARTLQGGMTGAGTLPRGPPHHHRSQGSYNRDSKSPISRNSDPPPSYAAAILHDQKEKASSKKAPMAAISPVHGALPTVGGVAPIIAPSAPSPYEFFDSLDGCDTRHASENRLSSSGGHLAHLSGSHSHHRGGHSTLGRLPSHASHHDHHINLTGPNNDASRIDPKRKHMQRSTTSISTADNDFKYDTLKSKSGTLRSTKSSVSSNYDYCDDPSKPTKTDLLTSKARGSVYNSTVGISSSAYANVRNDETTTATIAHKPQERTATLNTKYSTLGRRPLPLTPDEMKQSKETPIPRVPDEMPLSAANLTQYRSLQRSNRSHNAHFNSLQRPHVFKPPSQQQNHQQQNEENQQHMQQSDSMTSNETERQLYAVTEL